MSAVIQWQLGLTRLLETTYVALSKEHVSWAVIGSAAAALQNCQMTPNDIDLLLRDPTGVYHLAALMAPYTPPICVYQHGDSQWVSS